VTAPGGRVRYQWQVQLAGDTWVSIAGATGASYTPDASLAGSRLRVVAQTAAGSVASAATARLKAALRTTPAKAPRIGSRLRARLAASVLAKGARVRYRWQLLDHGRWLTIVGATKATYTPNRGAAGRNLRVVATAGGRTLAARATPPVRRAAKR
jgi:hypothetical protein